MHLYTVVKFLHIVAVIVCVGGLFARQLIRQHANRSNDVHTLAALVQAAGRIDSLMVIPGMTAIMILGVILALIGGLPILGFLQGAAQNWLLAANILLIGILAIIPTVLVPSGKRFEPLLHAALQQGVVTAELRAAMNDRTVRLAHIYEEVALVVITALMVTKPF